MKGAKMDIRIPTCICGTFPECRHREFISSLTWNHERRKIALCIKATDTEYLGTSIPFACPYLLNAAIDLIESAIS
jgi:hypothetical protein